MRGVASGGPGASAEQGEIELVLRWCYHPGIEVVKRSGSFRPEAGLPSMNWLLSNRWRMVLILAVAWAVLDAGRSLYARVGYAEPSERWQPEASHYADLTWPPGADVPAAAPMGERVYATRCAVCHGPDGRGNGPAAPSLIPRPTDFTRGEYKYKSTAFGQPPTEGDLLRTVTDGLPASAMPYWRDLLSPEEIRAVVTYMRAFSPTVAAAVPVSLAVPVREPVTAKSMANGERLFLQTGCSGCHAANATGGVTLRDQRGSPVVSRDLAAPWAFRGGHAPEALWLRLTIGLSPGPMPSFAEKLSSEERWDVVAYVLSLARVPAWESGGALGGPGQNPNPLTRGEYLVRAEMCGLCHTQINATGIYRDDAYLAGGMRVGVYPQGVFVSRNLTSDPATGLGNWTEAQVVNALRSGQGRDRALPWGAMPWPFLHGFSDADAGAIARYLKTSLTPVYNQIPQPLRYGTLETVWVKLTQPQYIIGNAPMSYADGNFGLRSGGLPRDLPQTLLFGGQWLIVLFGLAGYFVSGVQRTGKRWHVQWRGPANGKQWAATIGGGLGFGVLAFVAMVLSDAILLTSLIPPEQVAQSVAATLAVPAPDKLTTPEQRALAERGRYVYATQSCALCHGMDASGGLKVSWKPFGTLWARNLTPDPATGLGNWREAEIARAIRSGVTPDGRALHWQGMIWDHASNLDEEDVRALITYLRAIPPVTKAIPAARPPAADDCDVYTFWTTESWEAGCR